MELRREQVVIETDRYRLEGALTLPAEGYRSRLSDYVNRRDRDFFALEDVTLTHLDSPDEPEQMPVLMVSRRHIRLVRPREGG